MKNLSIIYSKISPEVREAGALWYKEARDFTIVLSNRYSIDRAKVTGILSALSPGTNYDQNKKDCEQLIKLQLGLIQSAKFTTYGQNVLKAKKIFSSDKDPLTFFNPKTGFKTYSFYLNILNPDSNEHVTIDRHAYSIATGETYSGLTVKQYLTIADHYKSHANKLGILACDLQAVLWVNYRIQNDIQQKKDVPF